MNRYFNNQELELLAPAGNFKIFKDIIQSQADAVYFGGKKLNMRVHRSDYNFNKKEIAEAVKISHDLNKKAYITINNMLNDEELAEAKEFLLFLEEVEPDGVIVQDFSILKLSQELGLQIPIHSSVMMNVHNREMIDRLLELGVTRVVVSREVSLEKVRQLSKETEMEFEYFVHGDMCIAHGGQCLYSGFLFGQSSNRGRCMKPCRWPYALCQEDQLSEMAYHLGVKDMALYRHIPELINSGVSSFKVEGRMRGSDYLLSLISKYADAINRYIEDPTAYYTNSDFKKIEENKARKLSTAYAFKVPGSQNLNLAGVGETKIFNKAKEEPAIAEERVKKVKKQLQTGNNSTNIPLLTVKVNSLEAAKTALDHGADQIYLAGEVFRPDRPFSKEEIIEAINYNQDKDIYLALPRMNVERQLIEYEYLFQSLIDSGLKGIVVTNLGAISKFKKYDYQIVGDYSLNSYNSQAADFYRNEGVNRITASIEAPVSTIKNMVEQSNTDLELIVQGAPVVMYLEHCIYAANSLEETADDFCLEPCAKGRLSLVDQAELEHPVLVDQYCRNHIIANKDVSLIAVLPELLTLGLQAMRIEGQHYSPVILGKVVALYRSILDQRLFDVELEERISWVNNLVELTGREQTLGSFNFD